MVTGFLMGGVCNTTKGMKIFFNIGNIAGAYGYGIIPTPFLKFSVYMFMLTNTYVSNTNK
jgi:hypothetical protein